MQDAAMCGTGTVSIRKHVKLPKADTYTHGKYVSFLEEEAVEQVQLCGGRFLVHTKWSAEAIKTVGTSDDEFKTPTEGMLVGPKALALAAPAVVYKVAPAKFRELVEPLITKVEPKIKLPPLFKSAKDAGVAWAKKSGSSSSSSSGSGSSGSVPMAVPPPLRKAQTVTFRAHGMSDSDVEAALDHRVNIATAAEAAIARAHERHRLRAARHPAPVLAAAEEEGITADDDAATVATYAALLETAARAGAAAGVINHPWGHFAGLDPYYDWSVLGLFCFSLVTRANCLAYATYSYSGALRPNIRYCHPGRAANGPGNGLPPGWGAGWALPPVQRAAVGVIPNDYDISGYLPAAQGGVLAGAMGGGGAAGVCATMLTYLQAGGAGYAGDALLNFGPAVASANDYHDVYVTFHKFAFVVAYNPADALQLAAVQDGNPVNVWDTTTHMLRIRANHAAVVGTDIPVAVWFLGDNPNPLAALLRVVPHATRPPAPPHSPPPPPLPTPPAAGDCPFHRRNSNAWFGGGQQWSDKNGGQPTRCCWPNPVGQDGADAGTGGFPVARHNELTAGGYTQVLLGYLPCGIIYSRPTQLMTAANGGYSPNNCAN